MQFVKNGYIDLSFENVFCEDGYLCYDQEWYFENVPLEFILYRAINNLYTYNSSKIEKKLKKEEMLEKFDLDDFILYFEQLEKYIQQEILDENAVDNYRNRIKNYYKDLENLNKSNEEKLQELLIFKEQNEILKKEKNDIENKYNELLKEYNTSRGWKIIKGFRKIMRKE